MTRPTSTLDRPAPRPAARSSRPAPRQRQAPPRRPASARPLRLGDTTRRLRVAVVVVAVVLTAISLRLLQIQGVDASAYATEAVGQRLTTVSLPAVRGDIVDADGTVLATSVAAVNVTADQTLVKDPRATAAALAPLLDIDATTLATTLTGDRRFVYVAKQVTPETWAEIKGMELAGLFAEDTTRRVYPAGDVGANVVGFVGAEGTGLAGVEMAMDELLAGTPGKRTYERGAQGRAIPTATSDEKAPVAGSDVQLTIDRDIQWAAQQAIAETVRSTQAANGTVIVTDVRTGAIYAMATAPTFDPTAPADSSTGDRGNRALSEIYEPGSTGKVMTAAAVLEEKGLGAEDVVTVPGRLERGGKSFSDSHEHGTLRLTFAGVVAKSSNIGTVLAAETIGPDALHGYLKKFGIGEPSGLGFPGESRGLLLPVKEWSDTSFPTIAFGQGLSVNAVQATQVFATIANDGLRVEPTMVKGTVAADGSVTPTAQTTSHRVVSPETAQTVRRMLESVVTEDGTAPQAAIPGYRVAGKTGTAQRVDPACGCYRGYTASFIGFAPADAPSLVVSVTIQDPKRGYYGGALAGPVFKKVMSFALQARQIPPTGTQAQPFRLSAD